jgi:outer membrane receptor protein involved in Fe transport
MNTKSPHFGTESPLRELRYVGALGVALLASAWSVHAQETASSSTKAPVADTMVLSPFVVNTDKDTGFVASSSLAGGRLAGELKDTPAAYSVQTREFIDALNLTDLSDASKWSVNTATLQDQGAGEIFSYGSGSTTQISFRGGSSAQTQRDFFPFAVNYDSYNLERIDYARGPNAVLFGNGDYSGTVNAVSRVARTDKSFNEVKAGYGSWNNARFTLDANAALNRVFALRLDAVYHDRDGWRDFDMERKRGASLASTINVTSTTQLRLQGEIGDVRRNNPFMTFYDRLSGWDGVTTLSARLPTTVLPGDAAAKGYTQYGNATTPVFVYAPAFNDTLDLSRTARTLGGNDSASVPVGGTLVVGPGANISGQPLNEALNLPTSRLDKVIAGSKFRLPSRTFAVSTNNPSYVQNFRSFSGFLNQRFGDRLFASIDANYSKERRVTEYINSRGVPQVFIDINRNLPDGSANPEFLRPYSEGYRLRFRIGNEAKSVRAAAAYVLKTTKLGDFSFNTAWQHSTNNYVIDPIVYAVKRNADPRLWSNTGYNDVVNYRYYWDRADFPTPEVTSVNFNGVSYPAGWIKDIANTSATPAVNYTTLDTLQAAAKAKLLNGRIHLLGAVRHDNYLGHNLNAKLPGDYPADWNGNYYVWRPAAPADYARLTYVPKDANGVVLGAARPATTRPRTGIVAQPQYANDRFQDDFAPPDVDVGSTTYSVGGVGYFTRDLSAFYNYSTTFNPSPARQNIYGYFYGPQVAAEWSAGLRETLAGGKLSLSLSYYHGHQSGQVFDQGTGPQTSLNTILLASPKASAPPAPASGQGNQRGVAAVPRFFDQRDLSNHGWEFELTANPTRAWRVTFNAALARAYQQNVAPEFIGYLAKNNTVLRQIVADAGVAIDAATGVASVDTSVPLDVRSPDAGGVASAWNNLQSVRANIVSGTQLVSRLPLHSANLFTDYTFREGALRGFKVGGGVNYRGRQAIGYRGADTIVDPSNPNQSIDDPKVSALDPVYTHGYTTATLVLGHSVRVNKRLTLQFDFRIDNLFDYKAPLYVSTVQRPPGGDLSNPSRIATPSQLYYLVPRSYMLTTTVKF